VMKQHIDLYVNNYSIDLRKGGKEAIEKLFEIFLSIKESGNVHSHSEEELFI